jgi:hypothetical protein
MACAARNALATAGVEFIVENGGGPGARLRKKAAAEASECESGNRERASGLCSIVSARLICPAEDSVTGQRRLGHPPRIHQRAALPAVALRKRDAHQLLLGRKLRHVVREARIVSALEHTGGEMIAREAAYLVSK